MDSGRCIPILPLLVAGVLLVIQAGQVILDRRAAVGLLVILDLLEKVDPLVILVQLVKVDILVIQVLLAIVDQVVVRDLLVKADQVATPAIQATRVKVAKLVILEKQV